jgi:tetratricopeptide (TPR) repeat protein
LATRTEGCYRTDGATLLRTPFIPKSDLEMMRLAPSMLDASEHMEDGRFDAARRALDVASQIAPGSFFVRCDLASLSLLEGRHADAREQFIALAAEPTPHVEVRWLLLNNLAWANYMLDNPELRDEADRASREAIAQAKHSLHAMGTRGAVLGWLGKHDDALALLDKAFVRATSPSSRALTACGLAISWAAYREVDLADRWVARARKAHPACPLLGRAQAAIARARATLAEPVAAASDPAA